MTKNGTKITQKKENISQFENKAKNMFKKILIKKMFFTAEYKYML
jgi:hypothetical protein